MNTIHIRKGQGFDIRNATIIESTPKHLFIVVNGVERNIPWSRIDRITRQK